MEMKFSIIEGKKAKYLASSQAVSDFKLLLSTDWGDEKRELVWASWIDYKSTMLIHGRVDKMDVDELFFFNGYLDYYFRNFDILGNEKPLSNRGKMIFNRLKERILERLIELGAVKW
jgi:hypothetical protein